MVPLFGAPILEHIVNDLPREVDELVIVVGYLKDQIMGHFGARFGRFRISYVEQSEPRGTYPALLACEGHLPDEGRFLVMYADDLHGRAGLSSAIRCPDLALLVAPVEDPRKFGVVDVRSDGRIEHIEEKPEHPRTNLVSTGVLTLTKDVFRYPARPHTNGERYLTDSIAQMIEARYSIRAIQSTFWLPLGCPQDLAKAERILGQASPTHFDFAHHSRGT